MTQVSDRHIELCGIAVLICGVIGRHRVTYFLCRELLLFCWSMKLQSGRNLFDEELLFIIDF
jgi:hypothetical protein